MKKRKGIGIGAIVLIVILALVVLFAVAGIGQYNGLVNSSEDVDKQWANVETVLQRRYDLIPNLVESVKGAMKQEQEVFGQIADARAKMAGANTQEEQVEASNEIESALGRLFVVMENYPELKSNQNVTALMDELAGTENRISVERGRYNEVATVYNKQVKTFPTVIFANMLGFDPKPLFAAQEGAANAPAVDFDAP